MVDKHDEWCKVEEETDVEHSPELVDDATESEEASAFTWVFNNDHRFVGQVDFVFSIHFFLDGQRGLDMISFGFVLHKSMEGLVEVFTDDLLDRVVYWQCVGIHIIESGHTSQSSVEKQNEEVACLTVDEDDGHELKDDRQEVLSETKNESV